MLLYVQPKIKSVFSSFALEEKILLLHASAPVAVLHTECGHAHSNTDLKGLQYAWIVLLVALVNDLAVLSVVVFALRSGTVSLFRLQRVPWDAKLANEPLSRSC